MANLFEMLFGCRHKRLSFPIATKPGQKRPSAASPTGTFVVCLDCGKEFAYDWQQMKIVTSRAFLDPDTGRVGYGKSYGENSLNGNPLHSLEDSKTGS